MKHYGYIYEQHMKWFESIKALDLFPEDERIVMYREEVQKVEKSGEVRVFDYAATSNILIAGAPKQGKSTTIGVILDAIRGCFEANGIRIISIDTTKPHWDAPDSSGQESRTGGESSAPLLSHPFGT